MRAVTIQAFGDPGGMTVVDRPDPVPAPGQVLIEVAAIGVGGVDAVIRRGTIGSGFPAGMVPGGEVAGEVVAVGEGVDRAHLGSRVWAFVRAAQFATAARGGLHSVVQEVLPLEQAAEAHRRMDAGEVFGRFVLVP